MRKTKWLPNRHSTHYAWRQSMEETGEHYVAIRTLGYDEGLGAPSALETNPENANFVEDNSVCVYPESQIVNFNSKLKIALTKGAIETDKLHTVRVGVLVYALAFKEDYTAIDELSQAEIQDVLSLETESTDRQGFITYNTVKVEERFNNSSLLHTNEPGLTTSQKLEYIGFTPDDYYDMLHYKTNAGKLRKVQSGIKWFILTQERPFKNIKIHLKSKVKFSNQYMQMGVMVLLPPAGTLYQTHNVTETSAIGHIDVELQTRFDEYHQDFNFSRI